MFLAEMSTVASQTWAGCTRDLAIFSHVHQSRDIRGLAIHRRHVYMLPERLQLHHTSSMDTFCGGFVLSFLHFKRGHHSLWLYWIWFSTETPGVFCELEIFTHPHIGTGVSRYYWVNCHFWVNYHFTTKWDIWDTDVRFTEHKFEHKISHTWLKNKPLYTHFANTKLPKICALANRKWSKVACCVHWTNQITCVGSVFEVKIICLFS